jgi:hypothetical protein
MQPRSRILIALLAATFGLFGVGCAGPSYTTSPYHPGPAIGRTVGTAVGGVAGTAAGAAVGFGESTVGGVMAPFDTTTRVVRRWHTEVTPDGRTVQVPEDILVDAYGRPVNQPPPPPQVPPQSEQQPTTNFSPK